MKHIGAHFSIAGGFQTPLNLAKSIGANAFAIFTKSPKSHTAAEISDAEAQLFIDNCANFGFDKKYILPHASYIINLANPDKEKREKGINSLINEMKRCEKLGLDKLNFHPGAHLNGYENFYDSLKIIAEGMNKAISEVPNVKLVIENMAGQGTTVGNRLFDIGYIVKLIDNKEKVGVCIDTCHAWAAGYDLNDGYKKFWEDFGEAIGMEYLSGIHINDSMQPLASKKDRHQSIGLGTMGLKTFENLMKDDKLNDIPFILETPNPDNWKNEIITLRALEK